MKLAITGATGLVGRFVAEETLAAGDTVLSLGRNPPRPGFFSEPVAHMPFELGAPPPSLEGIDGLIHLAFQHLPGRYRGGEGTDPDGFRQANLDGTMRLFEAARRDGVKRILFLSSRAVYGDWPAGTRLHESLAPRPDTLYGEVKWRAEQALAGFYGADVATASLRATGVYGPAGPGQRHKWEELFHDFFAGTDIAPRAATEVHGADVASAVRLLLKASPEKLGGRAFNLSDLVLDRRDLLRELAQIAGMSLPLPQSADVTQVSQMDCARLRDLGWKPGGWPLLQRTLKEMFPGL
ncbi:NAD-dependent epimerase/dehydratase family protein [Aliiruegeria lutimaris]|uniref:Nucleoside-diphosphate-sugar epimerase n=1 Tax=Aliiruegeria lutimaris TaxID=571298 RepID=A0A1G8K8G3_9RHOB|nr:NAD(P)-dependent oxidoreductase [Aliiruegeria lutimaris]SDI39745.1 Nucleoside-diphosphate-sugar epimerase [Aliiruegeria lutimaris]